MQDIGRKYPDCVYGGMFLRWIFDNNPKPYNSFGNGAAMRISPAGWAADSQEEVIKLSQAITGITHNHPEGIKGAEATAVAIFMARNGYTKEEISKIIINNYYELDFTLGRIRNSYEFNETCQETVPQAIEAFLESDSFEDAVRNAISIGGDSDTLAAITGSIAEAYYGIDENIKQDALKYLDPYLRNIYDDWVKFISDKQITGKFRVLTKYVKKFSETESLGEWIIDRKNDGSEKRPMHMPFVNYGSFVYSFESDFFQFLNSHPEYNLTGYDTILENNGLKWDQRSMENADVNVLDEQCILALITGAFRAENFCDGALMEFFKKGCILKWLRRLKSLDENNK